MAFEDFKSMQGLRRREAVGMDELMDMFVKNMKIASGLNEQRIADAWDEVTGAGRYTLDKYVRGGTLYVTLSSSVLRDRLSFQKTDIVDRINDKLKEDPLFTPEDKKISFIKSIVLK